MRPVYVLDMNGKPLMPTCRFGKVRRMLKSGEAKVVDTLPFTIQLDRPTKTHVVQSVTLGCDPGRTNIGLLQSVPTERICIDPIARQETKKSST